MRSEITNLHESQTQNFPFIFHAFLKPLQFSSFQKYFLTVAHVLQLCNCNEYKE